MFVTYVRGRHVGGNHETHEPHEKGGLSAQIRLNPSNPSNPCSKKCASKRTLGSCATLVIHFKSGGKAICLHYRTFLALSKGVRRFRRSATMSEQNRQP